MRKVRQNLGLKPNDTSRDEKIEAMSKQSIFNRVCNWEGFTGYGNTIVEQIEQIYGIDLNEMGE